MVRGVALDPATVIQTELASGERLLWYGQPRKGMVLRTSDILLIPFSLLWGGFAVFWEIVVVRSGAPLFFQLWGIPFVIIGLYMIFGRFIGDAKQRNNTFYGVTNERIIIVSELWGKRIKSLNLRTLSNLSLDRKPDGSGTITFGSVDSSFSWPPNMAWPGIGRPMQPSFELIPDA